MPDFILFMHRDVSPAGAGPAPADWSAYLARLEQAGVLRGGSSIGDGICMSRSSSPPAITQHLSGYIRIQAESLRHARDLVQGNPVFEAGGTVEIRELPRDRVSHTDA
jgi:hypothetical protein